jgi:hypothetical protein
MIHENTRTDTKKVLVISCIGWIALFCVDFCGIKTMRPGPLPPNARLWLEVPAFAPVLQC